MRIVSVRSKATINFYIKTLPMIVKTLDIQKISMAYQLNEDDAYAIENILGDLTEKTVVEKTLERGPIILAKLNEKIIGILETQQEKMILIKDLSPALVGKLIIKVLSYLYTKKIQQIYQNKDSLAIEELTLPINSTATAIGNSLIEAYAYKNILYHERTERLTISTNKYKKVEEHKRITNEEIEAIIKEFETLTITDNNNMTVITKNYLILYADEHHIVGLDEKKRTELQTNIQKAAQNIGVTMLELLSQANIITNIIKTITHKEQTKVNIPHIQLQGKIINDFLYTPLSFNQPRLSTRPLPAFVKITDTENKINLNIMPNYKAKIFFKENKNILTPTSELKEILKSYNEIPHTINKQVLTSIIELYKTILLDTTDVLNNEAICNLFKSLYFIDLNPIIDENNNNIDNMSALAELVQYSMLLNTHYNKNLQAKIQDHASFRNIYNKVSSYKYIIKGLLNDANLYSHFKYFYIEKYLITSGRLNSSTYFLQLQGYKLALSLVNFMPKQILNEEQYIQYIKIIKETVPEIKIHPQVEISFATYKNQNNNLYLKQILSMFKAQDMSIFKHYVEKSTLKEQLHWICLHIKKTKEIWTAYSLLEKYKTGDYSTGSQQQDVTSSVVQLVGMLQNNAYICTMSNIIGKEYTDIYSVYCQLLRKDITKIIDFVNIILNPIVSNLNKNAYEGRCHDLITKDQIWDEFIANPNADLNKQLDNPELLLLYDLRLPLVSLTPYKYKDKLKNIISQIRVFVKAEKFIKQIPIEILNNRGTVKKLIMMIGYNAGGEAGTDAILEYLTDCLYERGYHKIPPLQELSRLLFNILIPDIT
jgi:hypothetical protein